MLPLAPNKRYGFDGIVSDDTVVLRVDEDLIKHAAHVLVGASLVCDLTDIEQAIIVERYMHNKSWRQIERECDYSIDSIFRLHHTAITKISKSQQ